MTVKSTKEYVGVPRDLVANFNGKQLVYVRWDQHLLFATALVLYVSPEMTFRELLEGQLKTLLQPDPDVAAVNWANVEWQKSGRPWTPDFDRSLAANGIVHKEQLSFRTPGLNSLLAAA